MHDGCLASSPLASLPVLYNVCSCMAVLAFNGARAASLVKHHANSRYCVLCSMLACHSTGFFTRVDLISNYISLLVHPE